MKKSGFRAGIDKVIPPAGSDGISHVQFPDRQHAVQFLAKKRRSIRSQ